MTADAGLASIQARFRADLGWDPNLTDEAPGDPEPQDPMARLILALDRNTRAQAFHDRKLLEKARAIYPVPIPAMPYTVVAGALTFGAGYGGSQHMGPRTGEFWDITRLTVDGLAPAGGVPAQASGAVAAPGALTTIAIINVGSITPGQYLISWNVSLDAGAPAAPTDDNNMRLRVNGVTIMTAEYPAALGVYAQPSVQVTFPPNAGSGILVQSIGAATAGVTYGAEISITPIAVDQVTLFKRYGSPVMERLHTFTAPGSTPGADWAPGKGGCVMRDGDALQLTTGGVSLSDGSQVILSGEAVRVAAEWVGEYFG